MRIAQKAFLAKDFGEPCEAGLRLNLRLTHQEIASALSTTRVTVTRVLGQFGMKAGFRLMPPGIWW